MVNYVHEHDFIDTCIYMCIREEASSYGLNLPTKSSNPKICIFLNTYMYICAWNYFSEHGCI